MNNDGHVERSINKNIILFNYKFNVKLITVSRLNQ
jgi:hypothetical protein